MSPSVTTPTQRRGFVALIAFCGLAVTLAVWHNARSGEKERILSEFRRRSEAQARVARERILIFREMLFGLRGMVSGQGRVSRSEFRQRSRELTERYPSIKALQWVPLVAGPDRPALEARASRELGLPYEIREHLPDHRFAPARKKEFYYPILYVEPLAGNEIVLGYDITTAPTAAELERARTEQRLVTTQQFPLAQASGPDDHPGVIFIVPVFTAATEEAPREFRGFIQGVFQIHTTLGRIHRERPDDALLLYYIDADATDPARRVLYANLAGVEPRVANQASWEVPPDDPTAYREVIEIGGRHWVFLSHLNPTWMAGQQTAIPLIILLGGLLATAVGCLFVNMLVHRTRMVEAEVAERTAELLTARQLLEEDVRQREATEVRLRESEARLQAILENSPNAIFVKDLEGRYLLFNRTFEAICHRPADRILGRTDQEIFPESIATQFRDNDRKVLATGRAHEFEKSIDHGHGNGHVTSIVHKFPLRTGDGQIFAIGGIATDITERARAEAERRELERRMQASQKLESLGVLAGGIAHDFNNILTAVLGNASLARQIGGPRSPVSPQLGHIETAARRAADLCQQMLAYAGRGRLVTDHVDLNEIVRGTATLLEVSISKNTALTLNLAANLPPVLADPTQLRQIVMNLVINSADAIGEQSGRVGVRTSVTDLDALHLARAIGHPNLPGGSYVAVEVTDDGCGMSAETVARIFEPFFTTKFSGRGLGLSAVLGIVQSHRGALFVESTPGAGSTFRLLLPVAAGAVLDVTVAHDPTATGTLRGTVLVVDDEGPVREITAAALAAAGLKTFSAASGEEGIELCRKHGRAIDLVLLDMTMPGISGDETLRRLRLIDAPQKVILMSGYSESDALLRIGRLGANGFLQKPFELATLLEKIAPLLPPA